MVRAGTTEGYPGVLGALTSHLMRRPQSAFGLVAVMSSLLVVSLSAVPAGAAFAPVEPPAAPVFSAASDECTRWASSLTPPATIRVLRTEATDAPDEVRDTVVEVDFREYVATVMAAEWPEHYPLETIKAGAVATKQFAWYYIVNPRGLTQEVDGEEVCYDVVDSTRDQFYKPETRGIGEPNGPGPKILGALEATWDISLRKFKQTTQSSRFILTGYRNGASTVDGRPIACGEDATGFKLFHNSTQRCGRDGLTFREILRKYLKPNLEIVEPGHHDIIGSRHGDASAMRRDGSQFHARVWTPGRAAPEAGSGAGLSVSGDGLVDYRSVDVDGDGRDDVLWLRQTGPRSGRVRVALSDGVNYGPAEDWWAGDTIVPLASAHLLVGDFYANGRADIAILGKGTEAGTSQLVVLKRKQYGRAVKFEDPRSWWAGGQDSGMIAAAWAGDLSGDGRADLIIRQDIEGGGVKIRTAVTKSPLPGTFPRMGPIKTRFESTALKAAQVKTAVGDANRDGREDVLMLIGGGGRARVERLQGALLGGFKRVRIWVAPKSDPIPVRKSRLGTADIDYDGRTDLVIYSERNGGTRIRVLKTRYDRMVEGPDWQAGIPWNSIRPY
jgi:hypothetical protein